jgi:hypothetical protein
MKEECKKLEVGLKAYKAIVETVCDGTHMVDEDICVDATNETQGL